VCLLLWLLTVGGLLMVLGYDNVFSQIAVFFSKMATVTFGGAYAVLAYVAQQGVENFQWLQPGEMLEGLGLAETTPGPLILVTQFVGFLAAYRQAAVEPSLLYASMGALLTLWVTFLPCFLWIFAGAPYVEKLRANQALSAALSAITAVVVGVIANLAVWFAVNALFAEHRRIAGFGVDTSLPVPGSVDVPMLALAVVAFVLVFRLRLGILPLLGITATIGALWVLWAT
jgi:chromate transporter